MKDLNMQPFYKTFFQINLFFFDFFDLSLYNLYS